MKTKYSVLQITFIVCFLFFQTLLIAQRDIYLVIGQSNACGRATIEAEDMVTLTGVDLYNGTTWESAVNTAGTDGGLNRYSTIQKAASDQGLNFAYTFGRMLNEVTGDQIGLVVNARGGTSINSWTKGHADDYYGDAITEITAALALGGSTLKGVLWHQGESDRNSATYIAKLTTLISDLRTDLGLATLPFISGQLSMQRTDNGTFNSNIEALAVTNTDYASTDGLQTLDLTHFNSNAQRVLGYRYAAKVLEMVYGYTYVQNQIMYVTEDAYVRGGTNSGTAYGITDSEILRVKETSSNPNNSRRGLLKFDVSPLTGTVDRLVVDATLMLNADNAVDNGVMDVSFYDITTSWSEGTVVWDDVVADFTTAISTSTTTFDEDRLDADGDSDTTELIHGGADLTEFIKDEYDSGTSTLALGLKSETDGAPQFKPTTKDHSTDFALRPYIIASYLEIPTVVPDPPTTKLAKLTFETDPLNPDPNSSVTDITYTTSRLEHTDGGQDYFTRTDGSNIAGIIEYSFDNSLDLGDYFFGAQDIDDGGIYPETATMYLEQINISGYENLELRVYLAEDQNTVVTLENWDNNLPIDGGNNDYVHFNFDIDETATFTNLLWIESSADHFNNLDNDNKEPKIDTDYDGIGDGAAITTTFTQFTKSITGTGDLLDIVIEFSMNNGNEDIAIDNIEIWGTLINATCSGTDITWNGSAWSNGTGPDITTPAVIDGDYSAFDDEGSFSACSLTVNTPYTLTIEESFYVEIEHDITVNGDLIIEGGGSLVQNDDTGTYINSETGESKFIKSTDILEHWYDYTYWSSPMSDLTIASSPLSISTRSFWHDANNYLDVLIEVDNTDTFTAGSDNIDDNGDDWQWTTGTTPMTPGIGFAASHTSTGFTSGTAYEYEFVGEFNNGEITAPIVYDVLNTGGHWNLLGNPYPSALDFDAFITNNPGIVDGLVYLWSQATDPIETASGNEDINFSNSDYIMMNTGSGSVNNSPDTLLEYIPSGQSFFIAGLTNANVTFNNSMRIKNGGSNGQFFKNSNSKNTENTDANKIWLNLLTDSGGFNQILIAYVEGATNDYDGLAYDAPRLLSDVPAVIYTQIEDVDNKLFAIQGKDVNSINEDEIIPIGFSTSIESPTIYSLSIQHLKGDFMLSNTIYLKDNLLSTIHDLSASDYSFTSEIGEFNNRFEILFNNNALSVDSFLETNNVLQIINLGNDRINFKTAQNQTIKNVVVYDLLGRKLYDLKGENNSETYTLSNLSDAVYIAKVELSNTTIITKRFINQ